MEKQDYTVVRPIILGHATVEAGGMVSLYPRQAAFWLADGTIEPIKQGSKTAKGAAA